MKMKKTLKMLISIIICFMMFGIPSYAEESTETTMTATWKTEYSTGVELVVTFKTPALYNQRVIVILYDADIETPSLDNVERMSGLFVSDGAEATVKFKIGNDLDEADGRYKVKIQGNGYLSEKSSEVLDVTLLTPQNATTLLNNINSETTIDGMASLIDSGKEALQIEMDSDPTNLESIVSIFLANRANETDRKFKDLNSVRNAWQKAKIIAYLQSNDVTADELKLLVEQNSELLGLDITDSDYNEKSDIVYQKVITYKNSYNDTGIKDCAALVKSIREFTAVEIINESSMDFVEIPQGNPQIELETAVIKHRATLGITEQYFNKFNSFSDTNRQKILRLIHDKGFTFAKEIVAAFNYGVDNTTEESPDPDPAPPSNNNSYGGGSLGGGSTGGNREEDKNPQQSTTTKKFIDVSDSHWAHTFIEKLSEEGIISGYQDGSFRPEADVKREEFLKMVVMAANLFDENEKCDFNDVDKESWYYSYVASAKAANIVNGIGNNMFGVGTSITREDAAIIIARIIDLVKGKDVIDVEDVATGFSDNNSISEYAKSGVYLLNKLGIISGFEDGTFRPKNFITRAQAARVIQMLCEVLN